jgi:hypothetical protein
LLVSTPEPKTVEDLTKTRTELANEKLLEASEELGKTLKEYVSSADSKANKTTVQTVDQALSTDESITPETLAKTVEFVLSKQQNQKPTVANKIGRAIGKLYPLASLTLGMGSAAAEVASSTQWFVKSIANADYMQGVSFLPIKGTFNCLSLLLTVTTPHCIPPKPVH